MAIMMMPHDTTSNYSIGINSVNTFVEPKTQHVTILLNRVSSCRRKRVELPETFHPHPYSVVLGRGKVNDFIGNRRLKVVVALHLRDYVEAKSRREKSYVVARVMDTIREACVGQEGAFVRCEDGIWYEVEDRLAREKIGVVFRDQLSHQYKSSTKNKVARRRQRKELKKRLSSSSSLEATAEEEDQGAFETSFSCFWDCRL